VQKRLDFRFRKGDNHMPTSVTTIPPKSSAPSYPPSDPAADLQKLKDSLKADQDKSADLTKEMNLLKAQIADLQKSVDEIDSKGKNYEKGLQTIEQQKKDLETYFNTKKAMLEATVPNKEEVSKTKERGDKEVTELVATVTRLQDEVTTNTGAYQAAKADTQQKQQKYTSEVNLLTRNDVWIKDLGGLRTAIEKEDTKNNVSRMYFLILEMADVFKKLDLPRQAEYLDRLKNAASELSIATNTERDKKQALDDSTANLRQAEKDLEEAKSKRRDKILQSIPEKAAAVAA